MSEKNTFTPHRNISSRAFTNIPNRLIRDGKIISDSALRLLSFLLSNSETWIVYQTKMRQDLDWGRDKMQKYIKELEEKKYLIRTEMRGIDGRFAHHNYEYCDTPLDENSNNFYTNSNNFTATVFSGTGKPEPTKNNTTYCSSSTASPSLTRSEPSDPPSEEAIQLAELFSSSLKGFNSKALIDERETLDTFSLMQKENPSIGIEEMRDTIKYIFESNYWEEKITPSMLRKKFRKIYDQSNRHYSRKQKDENKKFARDRLKKLKEASKSNEYINEDHLVITRAFENFIIQDDGVLHKQKGEKVKFTMKKDDFIRELSKFFNVIF